jgi:membrane associated rhomboid family serine protease
MPPIPPITQFLMLACTAIFCLQRLVPLTQWLVLYPVNSGLFMPWQLITYAFLHADIWHLFFNMLGLWMFGGELEQLWGRKRYLAFLAMGALFGALTFSVVTLLMGSPSALVGFSGAIYALLLASAMLFPTRTIMPLFPPIPMKMRTFVIVFGVIALVTGLGGSAVGSFANLGALAHLGGLLGGWITIRYWRGQPPFRRR